MKNGIIKLLGALALSTAPVVSLVACGVDSAIIETWMARFKEVKVKVTAGASVTDKKKAATEQIKKELKQIGVKADSIDINADATVAKINYTLAKAKKDATVKINYDQPSEDEKTSTDKAIESLAGNFDATIEESKIGDDEQLKAKAKEVISEKLAGESANVDLILSVDKTTDVNKPKVTVEVKAKSDKGKATKKVTVVITKAA